MILQPVRYTYMHAYVYNVYTWNLGSEKMTKKCFTNIGIWVLGPEDWNTTLSVLMTFSCKLEIEYSAINC